MNKNLIHYQKSPNQVCLISDNWAPAHPLVLEAMTEANHDAAGSYGADPWTDEAHQLIQQAFKANCKIFMVPTGTGANVLALKLSCRRFESIICTDIAHIHYQESGAAESIVGAKLLTVAHQNGKMIPEALVKRLTSERAFAKHSTSPRVVSITQPTEFGTIYSISELEALSKLCKEEGLLLHIDGSRIYNAAVKLNIDLYEMISSIKVDILSLGGTKNGLLGAEALLIFNSSLYEGSDHMHKQSLQLLSKMRYLSCQYLPFFKQDLWKKLALHANQKAKEIEAIINKIPQLALSYPVETNQIFFTVPSKYAPLIQEKISCFLWDQEINQLRFIASWNTSDQDVKNVALAMADIFNSPA